jgi:hypothetical protein
MFSGLPMRRPFPVLLLSLAMLLQTSPIPLRAFRLEAESLVPAPIPPGVVAVPPVTRADLDGDGTSETLALASGRLSILSTGVTVWQSPRVWQVVQATFTDLNHDDRPEVTLLLWRPFQTWPVDQWLPNGGRIGDFHDSAGDSCHIILIGWVHAGYQELWAGSAMAEPVNAFVAADLDGDHAQELVTLESRYTDPRSAPARTLKVWEWNGFGFSVVSSMDGIISKMALVQAGNGHLLILVP